MELESACADGYLPAPTLSMLIKELVPETHSWKMVDTCPACLARSLSKFRTIKSISYSCCLACGFRFANPIPPNDVIDAFYNSPFYTNYRKFEERRIAHEQYFSISIGIDTMIHIASWLDDDKSVKILDYGCGPGTFLAILRDKFGFQNIDGIELNKQSVRIAKSSYGLTIASSISELRNRLYDYIIFLEVIEHIPEPDNLLEEAITLLKPGGRVVIATPAVDNPIGLFLPSHADAPYSAPCHVSLFTTKALLCLLSRFNFDVEQIELSESWRVIEKVITSLFYDLDFLSPRHDDDANDSIYIPNTLGKLLGLKPERNLSSFLWRSLRGVDKLGAHIFRRYPKMFPMNGHIYVLARRRAS